MDLFMKILGLMIGLGFIVLSWFFFFRGHRIITWIQKHKYHTTAEPRSSELLISRIIGVLLMMVGIYYSAIAIISLFI